jgi:hypothetical protein
VRKKEGKSGKRNDHENSPWIMVNDRTGIAGNDSEEIFRDDSLGRYEMYVVRLQLRKGLGVGLIDTGSQVSLIKESSLTKLSAKKGSDLKICGITGKQMDIKGHVELIIENTLQPLKQTCYVADSLPRNLGIILGQDWLDNEGYGFQKTTPIIIPPYSKRVIKRKTQEKGVRFIEHQVIKPGLICACSPVNCEHFEFPCLMVNLTDKPICMTINPKLEKNHQP